MLFTNFFVVHNIALSAANHARHLAHVSGKLNWRTIYTSLKIKLLCLKSNFATLKSSEGVAALVREVGMFCSAFLWFQALACTLCIVWILLKT